MTATRCPECRSPVDVRWIWDVAPTAFRSYALKGRVGVICATCGARLVVTQTLVRLVSLWQLAFIGLLVVVAERTEASLAAIGLIFLPAGILSLFISPWVAPSMARLRLARGDEKVTYPVREPANEG